VIVLPLLLHGLFLSCLLFFTLLPCQLDFDPVHAPHKRYLTLSSVHNVQSNFVKIAIVPVKSLLSEFLPVYLPDTTHLLILSSLTNILSKPFESSKQTYLSMHRNP